MSRLFLEFPYAIAPVVIAPVGVALWVRRTARLDRPDPVDACPGRIPVVRVARRSLHPEQPRRHRRKALVAARLSGRGADHRPRRRGRLPEPTASRWFSPQTVA